MQDDGAALATGRLIYLIGASGSGKDSLMRYARTRLSAAPVAFAHRYITRPLHDAAEDHVMLDAAEFAVRKAAGAFAMCWQAHGYDYGVGIEIEAWRARGLSVVVNGARRYLPELRTRHPDALVVWIEVSATQRAHRLRQRRREDARQIEQRLRTPSHAEPQPGDVVISNEGPIEIAGAALISLLTAPALRVQDAATNGV